MKRVCAVLAFHKIGGPPPGGWVTWNYVSVPTLEGYLESIEDSDWSVIDLPTFLAGMDEPESLPERSVLLTFDDGCRSMLTVAEPCLAEHGHPSVLYVPTQFVGGTNEFDLGAEPTEPICDWDDLRELKKRGVAVESHAVSHRAFQTLSLDEQREELRVSRERLQNALDAPVETFAYPFGDTGKQAEQLPALLEECGYRCAFVYKGGPTEMPAAERFFITRVPMGPGIDLRGLLENA